MRFATVQLFLATFATLSSVVIAVGGGIEGGNASGGPVPKTRLANGAPHLRFRSVAPVVFVIVNPSR
ncbi:hypothetical protein HYALB_00012095 [Hymenoscyphus albidus]|uniref:Uncharacterized protein n=1 Tax=Hymenoscyphus albidus TaxID=595503 RepID=A0A9N9Q519_9HELO|nr:hypothetical protein HYALB_00012095 [Hymenoscyphus albidus]